MNPLLLLCCQNLYYPKPHGVYTHHGIITCRKRHIIVVGKLTAQGGSAGRRSRPLCFAFFRRSTLHLVGCQCSRKAAKQIREAPSSPPPVGWRGSDADTCCDTRRLLPCSPGSKKAPPPVGWQGSDAEMCCDTRRLLACSPASCEGSWIIDGDELDLNMGDSFHVLIQAPIAGSSVSCRGKQFSVWYACCALLGGWNTVTWWKCQWN